MLCRGCGIEKPLTDEFFHRHKGGKYGFRNYCRECKNAKARSYIKSDQGKATRAALHGKYIKSGQASVYAANWRAKSRLKIREYRRKYRLEHGEAIRAADRAYRAANQDKVREIRRRVDAKRQRRPDYVLKKRIKARIKQMLVGEWRDAKKVLGYGANALKSHIERQFTEGMSWERLLSGEIHIDHIIPVSSFKIESVDDPNFKACWALSNLRPLWAMENQLKQAKRLSLL